MSNGNGHSWSKFFWRDWKSDGALHPCSLAAKGFWIEMLCLMHEGEPAGHLTVGGKPATLRQMAANAYCTEKEAAKYLDELEEAGVFSRSDDGTIYCRRMVKDAVSSKVGKEAAERRWKDHKPNGSPNGSPNREATGNPNGKPTREPNARSQNPESDLPPVGSPSGDGDRHPAAAGTPPRRADGTNLREVGRSPRDLGTNPRATGGNPRKKRARNGFHDLDRPAPEPPTIDGVVEPIDAWITQFRRRIADG